MRRFIGESTRQSTSVDICERSMQRMPGSSIFPITDARRLLVDFIILESTKNMRTAGRRCRTCRRQKGKWDMEARREPEIKVGRHADSSIWYRIFQKQSNYRTVSPTTLKKQNHLHLITHPIKYYTRHTKSFGFPNLSSPPQELLTPPFIPVNRLWISFTCLPYHY